MRNPGTTLTILCVSVLAGACAPMRYDVKVDAHDPRARALTNPPD
jgi:hypothetical protein